MKSFKVLLLGVLLPGALSATLYGAMNDDRGDRRHHVRVDRDVRVGVDVDEIVRSVEAELRALEGDIAAAVDEGLADASPGRSCAHTRTEVAELDADDISSLRLRASAGELAVTGRAGVDRIVVRSTMCASDARLLAGLSTRVEGVDGRADVTTEHPRRAGSGSRYARIDLEVEVPLGMPADIEDSSGGIDIRGTGETRIDDGSGDIVVRATTGGVTIRDGSGSIELVEIGGDVDLVDGSGELAMSGIAGSVALTDGSGSVGIRGVEGSVEVRADGSGSIDVADVGGDFTVRADGSGSITHSGVAGAVKVPRKR